MMKIWMRFGYLFLATIVLLAACAPASPQAAGPVVAQTSHTISIAQATSPGAQEGIHKIQHVIIMMQENRSFDSYFGTSPGADGIPMKDGTPSVCVFDLLTKQCVRPYHNPNDRNL